MAFKSRLKCLFLKPIFCILFATFLHFARNTTLEMQEKKKELKRERQMINEQQSRLFTDPLEIIKRDKKKMKSEKKKWDKQLELVENQLAKIKDVLRKIDDALRFYYYEATDEIKEQLKDPLNWKNHTQLDYYKDIDALY